MFTLTFTFATNANATDYRNSVWGHMLNPYLPVGEFTVQWSACQMVSSLMDSKYGWTSTNYYSTPTTSGNLYSEISSRQSSDVWAHDFWVGDFYPSVVSGTIHYNFYGHNSQHIHDYDLYTWTSSPYSKQHFSFIWTCACGNVILDPHDGQTYCYGYYDDLSNTGCVGMAYAWTHRTDLNLNGYGSPDSSGYCYMGWNSTSLGLSVDTGNPVYDNYYYFLQFFYSYLVNGNSIKSSLDYAANQIWGCSWQGQYCPLGYGTYFDGEWHWINVFGESTMVLP